MIKTILNKQELLQKIAEIPQFVKRDIFVKSAEIDVNGNEMYNQEKRLIAY